jgi:hypothetical protein
MEDDVDKGPCLDDLIEGERDGGEATACGSPEMVEGS